ncbi:MAG: hypothetical protein COX19_01490 [Desulfobacterales bacterium CG23_combo_of_CG06-09_8_20_14_all_51_8]|nr:MAG: hypothetical protein COX19_01490 [Desulfobacterales bacterium CG23_combo_of_CG06-09_8_20_14_all_51_8]
MPYDEDEPPLDDLPDDGNLPDLELIEESVAFINRTIAEMVKTVFLKIGDHLLTRYFNDSVELASSKNRYKNRSYTELCRRPELSVTRRELGVMIRMVWSFQRRKKIGLNKGKCFPFFIYSCFSAARFSPKDIPFLNKLPDFTDHVINNPVLSLCPR